MAMIAKTLGIQHRFPTLYYPQSNGAAENGVKIVQNTLSKMCPEDDSTCG